jgi:hypothetical protein
MKKLLILGCGALMSLAASTLPMAAADASMTTDSATVTVAVGGSEAQQVSQTPVVPDAGAPASAWDAYASAQRAAAENGTLEATMIPSGCTLTQFITSPSVEYIPSLGRNISLDSWTSAFQCPIPTGAAIQSAGVS